MTDATLRGSLCRTFETKTLEERHTFDTADTVIIRIDGEEARYPTGQGLVPTFIVTRSRRRPNRPLSLVAAATAFMAVVLVTAMVVVDATVLPAPIITR